MINNNVFRISLDAALKSQGVLKAKRNHMIAEAMILPDSERDSVLDEHELKARVAQAQKLEARRVKSELKEQCDYVAWFKSEFPGVVIMSIRNGGSRTQKEKAEQLLEGLHKGATDLHVIEWDLWIEFKKEKGGVLSEDQEKFRDYIIGIGKNWMLAEGYKMGKEKTFDFYEKNIKCK